MNLDSPPRPEPRKACFASSVIRLSYSLAPWPGQLNRYALAMNSHSAESELKDFVDPGMHGHLARE